MKTEEYIDNIVSAHSDMRWMDASELRTILSSVIEMAREEERDRILRIIEDNEIPYYCNKLKIKITK